MSMGKLKREEIYKSRTLSDIFHLLSFSHLQIAIVKCFMYARFKNIYIYILF